VTAVVTVTGDLCGLERPELPSESVTCLGASNVDQGFGEPMATPNERVVRNHQRAVVSIAVTTPLFSSN
jgi:hypothetical protein